MNRLNVSCAALVKDPHSLAFVVQPFATLGLSSQQEGEEGSGGYAFFL